MQRLIWHEISGARRKLVDQRFRETCAWDVTLNERENDSGELRMVISGANPQYDALLTMRSEIVVEDDGIEVWRGRIVNQRAPGDGTKEVTVKGLLDYLYDSSVAPQVLSGSAESVLQLLIGAHNASNVETHKRLTLGDVAGIADIEEYKISRRTKTWQVLKALIREVGGAVFARRVGDVTYIDWLGDAERRTCSQIVIMGRNLLSLEAEEDGADICTVLYGYGKSTEDVPLTVAEINDGLEYIQDDDAVTLYGVIEDSITETSIEDSAELLALMREELAARLSGVRSITAEAVDLSDLGEAAARIEAGHLVPVRAEIYGIDEAIKVESVKRYLYQPARTVIQLGADTVTATKLIRRSQDDY